ncbi:hypothetical protein FA95DRAFT_1609082 [Auriscalpium vulgare]|uniref:Uncharacterized protein n=1 Tax=Auriscalpium vulgare TaxID=40419 RepID=A0ACB8RIB7_9AGAM|nr:hypothetical protein FA95DRAFT_1609082 [Auriscalpium vulgare]
MDTIGNEHFHRGRIGHSCPRWLGAAALRTSVWVAYSGKPIVKLDGSIKKRQSHKTDKIVESFTRAKEGNGRLHSLGLVSDGGFSWHNKHVYALIETAKEIGVPHVYIHFLDSRDTDGDTLLSSLDSERPPHHTTMPRYNIEFPFPIAFPPEATMTKVLAEWLAKKGIKHAHIAETEKYAHVTFFFNGKAEERDMIASPMVARFSIRTWARRTPCTTASKVPFLITGDPAKYQFLGDDEKKEEEDDGALCDVTPTVLNLLALPKPEEISGRSLLKAAA